jgi:hypothetical protein
MEVTRVPNRTSPPAALLRESFREAGKLKTRTLANLSDWPEAKVEAFRRGAARRDAAGDRFAIERALPHGHVAAVLGHVRQIGLDRLLPRRPERLAELALALIAGARGRAGGNAGHRPPAERGDGGAVAGALLRPGGVDEDELYRALDLLVTSSYLEGRCCALARFGYSRDGRPDRPQSVFGLLCAAELPGGGRGVRG